MAIRAELHGPRGRAAFARRLGLSPTTYQSYESTRVPPGDVLLRIAEAAGVSVRWLITGEEPRGPVVAASHPVLQRAAALLAERPRMAAPLAAFVDLLAETTRFPAKGAADGGEGVAEGIGEVDERASWVPVLGRSAAGILRFWSDEGEGAGVTRLEELIARHASRPGRRLLPAVASTEGEAEASTVQLILLPSPEGADPAEFVSAPAVKSRHPDAFAVRIDGESMAPEIAHGDLVVLSPSCPAADGRAAVVQLGGQIGVTCKLYRREEGPAADEPGQVHLIAINEAFPPQTWRADKVEWAFRVLAKVRPQPPRPPAPVSARTSPT